MKSTIKLDGGKAVVIQPGAEQTVRLDITLMGIGVGAINLTPDQCGAILFGLEMALPENQRQRLEASASEGTTSAQRINRAPLPQGPRCGFFGCNYPEGDCAGQDLCDFGHCGQAKRVSA